MPASGGHGLTTYQVVAELQVMLACWIGRCPTCQQAIDLKDLGPARHTEPPQT